MSHILLSSLGNSRHEILKPRFGRPYHAFLHTASYFPGYSWYITNRQFCRRIRSPTRLVAFPLSCDAQHVSSGRKIATPNQRWPIPTKRSTLSDSSVFSVFAMNGVGKAVGSSFFEGGRRNALCMPMKGINVPRWKGWKVEDRRIEESKESKREGK